MAIMEESTNKIERKCRVMSYITKFAEGFMHLFQTGAETFIFWMTGIVPVVSMLMVAMNTLIAFRRRKEETK